MPEPLLSRQDFSAAVSRRDRNACVLCGAPGTEAHHILDRKLFPDGGYYLSNGALVCNPCHWDCETTKVTVEEVRRAAGITARVLPPGLALAAVLDKWGNEIREDGLRLEGPLAGDDGCRRALARGGYLGLLLPRGALA